MVDTSPAVFFGNFYYYSNLIYSALYPYLANQTNEEVKIVYELFNCYNANQELKITRYGLNINKICISSQIFCP